MVRGQASRGQSALVMKYIPNPGNRRLSFKQSRTLKVTGLSFVVSVLFLAPSIWFSSAAVQNATPKAERLHSKNKLRPEVWQAVGFAESVAARDLEETGPPAGAQGDPGEGLKINDMNEERVKRPVGTMLATRS